MSYYPYGLVSPQRPVYPQAYYPQSIPQQRQAQYSIPSQMFHPSPPIIRPPPQPYYPQYQKPIQYHTNYGQSPIKPQSALQQSYPINQQNQRYPNNPPQVFNQQQSVTRPTVPQYQYQIPAQYRGTTQQYYQPQQQQLQKQQPQQQYNQNKMVSPPKQSSQQLLPTQTKPQSPPSQHRPQSQQQQHQQVPQQQINKPPQQQKQPQISQKDDDLEKKFQDAIDRTRDLVQKYQNPQPQQQQVQQQQQQPNQQLKQEQKQDNDDQLQELALQYEDGYIYRGQGFEPAIREGYGILTDQNENTVYDGQWKDNQYDGQGKLINVQAEQIEGPFDYQDLSAIGNGWLEYEGEFSEGKMNGLGRLQLTNGEVFEGQFNDGVIHGEGIFQAINDQTIKGLWQEGVLTQLFA